MFDQRGQESARNSATDAPVNKEGPSLPGRIGSVDSFSGTALVGCEVLALAQAINIAEYGRSSGQVTLNRGCGAS